jgi:hypothetical protein
MTLCTGEATAGDGYPAEAPAAASRRLARWWTAALLMGAAALDLARCGIDVSKGSATHAPLLTTTGALAAAVSMITALGCLRGRYWVAWSALLIGVGSAPQAAATGFHAAYAVPDLATAAIGVLLTATMLASDLLLGRTTDP